MKCLSLLSLLILLSASKCSKYPPPTGELCLASGFQASELACNNPNLDEPKYFRSLKKGDVCVVPTRFQDMQEYCIDLRADLIKCKRNKRR